MLKACRLNLHVRQQTANLSVGEMLHVKPSGQSNLLKPRPQNTPVRLLPPEANSSGNPIEHRLSSSASLGSSEATKGRSCFKGQHRGQDRCSSVSRTCNTSRVPGNATFIFVAFYHSKAIIVSWGRMFAFKHVFMHLCWIENRCMKATCRTIQNENTYSHVLGVDCFTIIISIWRYNEQFTYIFILFFEVNS